MKLWLIAQTHNEDYDSYDSAVVAADTKEQAELTHPSVGSGLTWNEEKRKWTDVYGRSGSGSSGSNSWTDPRWVKAKLIGEAIEGTQPGVICTSFNAG